MGICPRNTMSTQPYSLWMSGLFARKGSGQWGSYLVLSKKAWSCTPHAFMAFAQTTLSLFIALECGIRWENIKRWILYSYVAIILLFRKSQTASCQQRVGFILFALCLRLLINTFKIRTDKNVILLDILLRRSDTLSCASLGTTLYVDWVLRKEM